MTTLSKDEILRLAREADIDWDSSEDFSEYRVSDSELTRFAHLCRADLVAEIAENDALRDRLSALLTGTANALKGDPGEDRLHDWSDLPKVAGELVAENAALKAVAERYRAALIQILKEPGETMSDGKALVAIIKGARAAIAMKRGEA